MTWYARDDYAIRRRDDTVPICPLTGACEAATGVYFGTVSYRDAAARMLDAPPCAVRRPAELVAEAADDQMQPSPWRHRIVRKALLIACHLEAA